MSGAGLSPEEKRALLKTLLRKKAGRKADRDGAVGVADLSAEAVLDPDIRPGPAAPEAATEPASIFLTGATGFLGAFLLSELLRRTRAEVRCLVRARDAGEGEARLRRTLASYSLPEDTASRVVAVPGDLSEPLLGLSEGRFRELAGEVDAIYHCGASVNWVYPYERLKPANVLGTREVLRLAVTGDTKPVHLVSTLGVFPLVGNPGAEEIREGDPLDHGGALYNGYTQSKWVAEKLVEEARSRGVPASIYRPALVTGSSRTGAWNTDDFTCRMIKTWIELGVAPEIETTMNLVPVDHVAEAIVHLSLQSESLGKNFHLANPRSATVEEMAGWIRAFGYPLRKVPYRRWRAALTGPAEGGLNPLAPLFSLSSSEDAPEMVRSIPGFDRQNTLRGLAGTDISCPPVDDRAFETYLSFFVRRGFLAAPASRGTV